MPDPDQDYAVDKKKGTTTINYPSGVVVVTRNGLVPDPESEGLIERHWAFECEFWPKLDGKCCDEILAIQAARVLMYDKDSKTWKIDNLTSRITKKPVPYQLPDEDGGWATDVGEHEEARSPYAGKKKDGSMDTSIVKQVGCKGRKKVVPMRFADWPNGPLASGVIMRKEFLLCFVCAKGEEVGTTYACLYWAFEFNNGEPVRIPPRSLDGMSKDPTFPAVKASPTKSHGDALKNFQKHMK